jgi:DnaJ-class molecular chaperone
MEQRGQKIVFRKESLSVCPRCDGHKRLVSPKYQGQDPRCNYCHGYGVVVNDITCYCGRPVRPDVLGQVEGALYSCSRKPCKEALLARKKAPPPKVPDDDAEAYAEYLANGGFCC